MKSKRKATHLGVLGGKGGGAGGGGAGGGGGGGGGEGGDAGGGDGGGGKGLHIVSPQDSLMKIVQSSPMSQRSDSDQL